MMTIDWQKLTTRHNYLTPPEIEDAGDIVYEPWHAAMREAAELYETVLERHGQDVAQYELIRTQARHRAIADAMTYVDSKDYGLGRLSSERRQTDSEQLGFASRVTTCHAENTQSLARTANFHMLELRTDKSGHANYRRICAKMHQLIKNQAGHHSIAEAMKFVDAGDYSRGRFAAEERRSDRLQPRLDSL